MTRTVVPSLNNDVCNTTIDNDSYSREVIITSPSCIIENDLINYDTESDESGYNDNNYIAIAKRRSSFVRKSIDNFSREINNSNVIVKKTLGYKKRRNSFICRLFCCY